MKKLLLLVAFLMLLTACGKTQDPPTVVEKEPEIIVPVEELPEKETVPEVEVPEPQPGEPETVEPPVVSAIDRMKGLRGEDITSIDYDYGCFTMEELAAALAGAAEHETVYEGEFQNWYGLTACVGEESDAWSSSEYFWITAGLEEEIVRVVYRLSGQEEALRYFSDHDLYWLIRNNYRQDRYVDMEAYHRYGHLLCARAQMSLEDYQDMEGEDCYVGYEIPHFVHEETIEAEGDIYAIYNWQPAFLVEDLKPSRLVGGQHLDPQGRMCGSEPYTHFVVKNPGGEEEGYAFLGWLFGETGGTEQERKEKMLQELERAFAGEYEF